MSYPRVVGRVGDVDPLNEGGVILDYKDGEPTLVYLVCIDEDEGDRSYLVYTTAINDIAQDTEEGTDTCGWVRAGDVERSCGMEPGELLRLATSDNIQDKCSAILAVAGHYGWDNFDSYPHPLTERQAEKLAEKWCTSERTGRPIRFKYQGKGN